MFNIIVFIMFILIVIWGFISWYNLIKDFVETRKAKKLDRNSKE